MIKRFTLLLFALTAIQQNFAQDVYWPEGNTEINTGSNATYMLQSVNFGGENTLFGYNLGAFYTDDSGNLTCGGFTSWGGVQTSIAVYGDDSTTPEKDGFAEGEQITWLAYGTFAEQTYNATVDLGLSPSGTMSTEIFSTNSINLITNFNIDPTVETVPQGCTDEIACNYDAEAEEDDGSCEYATEGFDCFGVCIDTDGDGICDFDETSGCTDALACNYNASASDDDGSCAYAAVGYDCGGNCIDTDEDDVCDFDEVDGCTDPLYAEYDELATDDDGSCFTLIVLGCTDVNAFNYQSEANTNDESCVDEINVVFEDNITNNTVNYNISEETIALTLGTEDIADGDLLGGFILVDGELLCIGYTSWTGADISLSLWIDDPNTPEIDGLTEGATIYWIAQQQSTQFNYLLDVVSVEVASNIFITSINVSESTIIGCMDDSAFNYNVNATINDGACVPFIYDCTDAEACNYNPLANTDDGTCYYISAEITELTFGNPISVITDAVSPSYTWFLNGDSLEEVSNELTPYVNGSYSIAVTDDQGCTVMDTLDINNVSLQENNSIELSVYPKPAKNSINVNAGTHMIHELRIYSLSGQLMYQSDVNATYLELQRKYLKSGHYYMEIILDKGKVIEPILFE